MAIVINKPSAVNARLDLLARTVPEICALINAMAMGVVLIKGVHVILNMKE